MSLDSTGPVSIGTNSATSVTIGRVGITNTLQGTSTIAGQLQINPFTTYSATPSTISSSDTYVLGTFSGAQTLNLPSVGSVPGKVLIITKASSTASGVITITPNGGDTINGLTSYILNALYSTVTLYSNGTLWMVQNSGSNLTWIDSSTALINFPNGRGGVNITNTIYWSMAILNSFVYLRIANFTITFPGGWPGSNNFNMTISGLPAYFGTITGNTNPSSIPEYIKSCYFVSTATGSTFNINNIVPTAGNLNFSTTLVPTAGDVWNFQNIYISYPIM